MWVVMTGSAKMPSSCWGTYRNVHAIELKSSWDYVASGNRAAFPLFEPRQNFYAGVRSKAIANYRSFGPFNVGRTDRCAYAKAIKRISERVTALNNANSEEAYLNAYESLGGSA